MTPPRLRTVYRGRPRDRARGPLAAGTGRWLAERTTLNVPHLGGVDVLVRHEPGAADPSRRGTETVGALAKALRAGEACQSGGAELPVVVLLTDVATSEVCFMSYFYEEELVCAGLPPLSASADLPAGAASPPGAAPAPGAASPPGAASAP